MGASSSRAGSVSRRILFIIDSLGRGGSQRQAYFLARGLTARGYAVRILALNDDTDPQNLAGIASVAEVEVIGKVRLALGVGPLGLWRRMRNWKPDIILTMLDYSDLLGRIAGRLYGRASVVTSIRGRNAHKSAWWLWLDRSTMKWAARVVFNSMAGTSFSQNKEGVRASQVCVINNGVEVDAMASNPADRDELGLAADSLILVTVGRLDGLKRIEVLLEAMARLPSDLGNVEILIVGDGPRDRFLREEVVRLGLTERAHFLGKREDVPALLALADVFVLPSTSEGMPNVVMEAMAAGCPVVATRIDGAVELLPDASYGWLVEPDNPGLLAMAIAEALRDRPEAQRRARRARTRAGEWFSVERMVERYDALFGELTVRR